MFCNPNYNFLAIQFFQNKKIKLHNTIKREIGVNTVQYARVTFLWSV